MATYEICKDAENGPEKTGKGCRRHVNELWNPSEMKKEFWGFMHYAGPPTISYALDVTAEIVALSYIAKIGERELAAAGLAFMLSNMTGRAVYTGMSTALGTIGSQAYGAQKYYLVGTILQQSLLVVGGTYSTHLLPLQSHVSHMHLNRL